MSHVIDGLQHKHNQGC